MPKKKKKSLINFNKSEILKTAESLFVKKGVSQTTLDEIAKEADYSKSTLYVYFKNKEDIYNHIVYKNMDILKNCIENCLKDSSNPKSSFFLLCENLVELSVQNPLFFNSVFGKISTDPEDFQKMEILLDIYNTGEEINEIIKNYVESASQKGIIKSKFTAEQLTFTVWGCIGGIIAFIKNKSCYLENNFKISKEEFADNSFKILWKSILN